MSLQNKSKKNIAKTISSVLFLTAMMSYFFYDWIEALNAVSLLKSHIKYSVASPFGAFLSLGICIWAWPAFFVALNYNISINNMPMHLGQFGRNIEP
ncbi:hypothetical protein [Shewanella sp. NFH-SH190041]|uniref:hypothetical protein n=1 Tax=Shewanella sp. NFH-SH190041 TaxID=2950245 RepID=UPI0021C32047|nr:hypothetical protein [Shewanella sp. NFH-SH190041]